MVRTHGLEILILRWLTGTPLHGRHHTNAGWFTRADRILHPSGRASAWQHQPKALRTLTRAGATMLALTALYGLAQHRADTFLALSILAALAFCAGVWEAYRRLRNWQHHRTYVKPLHHALGNALGSPVAARPSAWLTVPRSFSERPNAEIAVQLRDGFSGTAEARSAVTHLVCEKLALSAGDVRADYRMIGRPRAVFTIDPPPPAKVTLADAGAQLEAATQVTPFIGFGRGGKPVNADLDSDSPHVPISAGSGGGKSVTLR